jgi:hypothetical protein
VLYPEGGFAVDGDAVTNYPTPGTGDWFTNPDPLLQYVPGNSIFNPLIGNPFNLRYPFSHHWNDGWQQGTDSTVFDGSNKINDDPNTYEWKAGSVPNKNEINNASVQFSRGDSTLPGGNYHDLWCSFAADREVNNGDSYIDFEFLQKPLYMSGTTAGVFVSLGTDGGRTVGDILVTIEFQQGGGTAYAVVRRWQPKVGGGFEYVLFTPALGDVLCTSNTVVTTAPWLPFGQTQYDVNQYAEGALNLTHILNLDQNPCYSISTVFVRTRTSGMSTTSELKDFPGSPYQANIILNELFVNCPQAVSLPACSSYASILAAYNTWKAGFSHSGGVNPVTDNIAAIPALPANFNCTGGTLVFNYKVTDFCGKIDSCQSTFSVGSPPALLVNCPNAVNLTACTSQTDITTAYNNWLAGFSFSGGCNATSNINAVPPLPANAHCNGTSLSFTFSVNSDCETHSCSSTFNVTAPATLIVNCPAPVTLNSCTPAADILIAYNAWKAGFTYSGDCNVTTNMASFPALPANAHCMGAALSFTYVATGDCSSKNCTSTFNVAAPAELIVNCPAPVNLSGCTSASAITTEYNAWKAGFSYSGDCNVTTNMASFPALPANAHCTGAALSFTYVATGDCSSKNCTSTFNVAAPAELIVNCPAPVNLSGCTSASAITTAYNAWKAGFSYSGDCNVTTNMTSFPALPANAHCTGAALSFTYVATGDCSSKNCTSTFNVAAPAELIVNCPAPVNLSGCTSASAITTAYNAWKAGFTYSGDCNVTTNMASFPALPANAHCTGAALSFTYVATGDCSSKNCTSTFNVAAPAELIVNCPAPVNLSGCTSASAITTAYNAWKAGFSYSGDCNVTTNMASFPALPANAYCTGAALSFTYVATGDCSSKNCTSTFNVAAPASLMVTCPAPVSLTRCTSPALITNAYNNWKAAFTFSGDCNASSNIANIPALPENAICNGAALSFTYIATADCETKSCTSTFSVNLPGDLVINCPPPVNLSACTSPSDITTAYNAWKAGFTFTSGCNGSSNISNIPALPANPHCNGASLSFTYIVYSDCDTLSCSSSFNVAAPATLIVNCPSPVTLNACTPAADILIAYNAWKAGFSYSGDCNVTTNMASFPALPANAHCTGAALSFTYVATGDCSSKNCTSTFNVAAPAELVVNCPAPVNLSGCTSASAITTAYNAWKAGFTYSGDCNVTSNMASFPALPANAHCTGAALSFTYVATGDCSSKNCTSTFNVAAPAELIVNCPAPVNLSGCTSASAITTAYNAWKAGFSYSGDCNVTTNMASFPALPANAHCTGAALSFTYVATGDCSSKNCTSTFNVAAPAELIVNCPAPVNLSGCTSASAITTAYNAWKAGFSYSGDCNVTTNMASFPALPANAHCTGAALSFTYVATGDCSSKNCTSTFNVAAPAELIVNCPAPVNLSGCTSASAITTAYNAWKAGFSYSGDCNVTTNMASFPALPANAHCTGAALSFTYVATGDCSSKNCTSTFNVAAPAELIVNCPTPVNLSGCTSASAITTAYNAWKAGFSFSGDCNVTTNMASFPALPANAHCTGAALSFTYVATGDCSSKNCTSTFNVAAPAELIANCPAPVTLPACTSEADILSAYNNWKAGFNFSGDCNAASNIANFPALPSGGHCNGLSLSFTYLVTGDCQSKSCTSSFSVGTPEPLVVNCPMPDTLEGCTPIGDILQAYTDWTNSFTHSGGCNVTDNLSTLSVMNIDTIAGGTISFTFMVYSDCDTMQCSSSFTLDPCMREEFCTYTQGKYGNQGHSSACTLAPFLTPTSIMVANLLAQGPLTIGSTATGNYIRFLPGDAMIINNILPGGGGCSGIINGGCIPQVNGACLSSYLKKGKLNNSLIAQTLTLGLNLRINGTLGNLPLVAGQWLTTQDKVSCPEGSGGVNMVCTDGVMTTNPYHYYMLPQGVLCYMNAHGYAMTVGGLYQLANDALGGVITIPANSSCGGYPVSLCNIQSAVDLINNAFDECRIFAGYRPQKFMCPQQPTFQVNGEVSDENAVIRANPNPFTKSTELTFTVPVNDSKVVLEVYNLLGSKVLSMYEGPADAGLPYSFTLNAGGVMMSENVYIVVLRTSTEVSTLRIVLSR